MREVVATDIPDRATPLFPRLTKLLIKRVAKGKGKFIVFEGTDGSGKTTQAKLLLSYFKKNGVKVAEISFPRYKGSLWGKMVRRYLDGDFGKIDPYLASVLYAGDRAAASEEIKGWLSEGKVVVCNRYVGSNIGHMAAKFKKPTERKKYVDWLESLEYGENKIPREDLVILLQVPIRVTKRLMRNRKLDLHEKDLKYQEEVYGVYDYVAGRKKTWVKVDCTDGENILKPKEIGKKVIEVVEKKL